MPSCEVTTTLMALVVMDKATGDEAVPEVTVVPFILTAAPGLLVVGVMVTDVVALLTVSL